MNVFQLQRRLIGEYASYVKSFIRIKDPRIRDHVERELDEGLLWPEPLIQLNPAFEPGDWIDELVAAGVLHEECSRIFRVDKEIDAAGKPLRLHKHQSEAIRIASGGNNLILTTGTGSGKSLAYIVPIVDHVLRNGPGRGIRAVIVYPMNALANSQVIELSKFLKQGYPDGRGPVTFSRYTGQESEEDKAEIIAHPPDILLTNYVMLELLLTRPTEKPLVRAARGARFLVLDELHTYRGRLGADVAMLARRAREAFEAGSLQCIGTSATLAGPGALEEQKAETARVATSLFGAVVRPEHVVTESLRRLTPLPSTSDADYLQHLRDRVSMPTEEIPRGFASFLADPLSSWVEGAFGLRSLPSSGRLVRQTPRPVRGRDGAADELHRLTSMPAEVCARAIESHLLASYKDALNPQTGLPAFAFRLHQFISRGDTVYASIEAETSRYITVHGQQFVPQDRNKVLIPLVFCRECGQEYYCVRSRAADGERLREFVPRELSDMESDPTEGTAGFLFVDTTDPWPTGEDEIRERLPEDWLEDAQDTTRVRRQREPDVPSTVYVGTDGKERPGGLRAAFVRAAFRFCLHCGVSYAFRKSGDYSRLTSLATEGRSTATTILCASALTYLRQSGELSKESRKLLSFTDNRQDASLQAGHFNDFVEVGLLRSAIQRAVQLAGPTGLQHDVLIQRVSDALDLPVELYSVDPDVRFLARDETRRALQAVLGYRVYRDLKRGWRITLPNLEQCGLLEIKYPSLEELCTDESVWVRLAPALSSAAPTTRVRVAKALLDFMRRELAIKVDYLDKDFQDRMRQQSSQRLIPPWAFDEGEILESASVLYPRPSRGDDWRGNVFLSPRGAFGQFLRRLDTFPGLTHRMSMAEVQAVCRDLLEALRIAGLVEVVAPGSGAREVPGYQVPASAMIWTPGDGRTPFHDPIRVPRLSSSAAESNPFFVRFYRTLAAEGVGLEAREHTAQVAYDQRMDREKRFREGTLPLLFCSPTMELGVDIAQLNLVNLRNIPPTPANYAQRSGRAGRSGQPALVFSYCSTYSSHDQYFFRAPERMVGGAVSPPRLDLSNEDLIKAHIHAVWLAETGLSLGTSLKDILDLGGERPSLALLERVHDSLNNLGARDRASSRGGRVLSTIQTELRSADWFNAGWLEEILSQAARHFDSTCDRWRNLYRAARRQSEAQHRIIMDASKSAEEKTKARRLRAEAESQLELLTQEQRVIEADFYSYRYFASEGFLPGYSFPRLPLSAYIPGRRDGRGRDEYLSRPRFLAINEFGPRAIVYHEGSRYRINKVIMPVQADEADPVMGSVKRCSECGYFHRVLEGAGPDLCERCRAALAAPMSPMFRLQNVVTRRAQRISSDEEERMRVGYEIQTAFRFAEPGGRPSHRTARVQLGTRTLLSLTYGHAASLWRLNLGWTRRKNRQQLGFVLDLERGYWAPREDDIEDDEQDPMSPRTRRVIPYVEDRRNCLLIEPEVDLSIPQMASLQAAFKNAIQLVFQLEEAELAAEPLPNADSRRMLLFYEASEGGAGVLRRLIDDPETFTQVARQALELCHFDPGDAVDRRRPPRAREDCEAACYDCLMSYSNQRDHEILDRMLVRDLLLELTRASVDASPAPLPRAEHLSALRNQCQSGLERDWLGFLEERGLRLPTRAQVLVETCHSIPDFFYDDQQVAIYVDGPHHDYPDRMQRDSLQSECMMNHGFAVLRFGGREGWEELVRSHPNVFGRAR